jgi:hypothetical protein
MKSSYSTLHRTLDSKIQELERLPHPNQTLITDLKKRKLRLKEIISSASEHSASAVSKRRAKKMIDIMISEQKQADKQIRAKRKRYYAHKRTDKASLSG